MATIENFATIRYTSGGVTETTVSNLAQVSVVSAVSLTKLSLSSVYENDSLLTYILTVQNTSDAALTGVTLEDNLGTFPYGSMELTPLSYGGDAVLLINGKDETASLNVDTSVTSAVTFSLPALPSGSTANVVYTARINEFAPLGVNESVTNTATLSADSGCAAGTAAVTLNAEENAKISVFKQMSPNPVVCGNTLTYSIQVYNYGNTAAENVQLTDSFDPAPTGITVSRNGSLLTAAEYTYENGVLTITGAGGDTVPAATFTRDTESGMVSVSPGTVEYVITGTI